MKPLNTRFLTVLFTLAFLGFSVTAIAKGKPPNPEVVYTAVMAGDFNFPTMDLTARKKGKSLSGNDTLEMITKTDAIFDECSRLLGEIGSGEVGVVGFDVPNWSISHTKSKGRLDQIHLTMNNLTIYPAPSTNYSQVDFDLHLHGEIGELDDFLPESGSVDHKLTNYMLWAGGKGDGVWFVCNSTGNGIDTWEELPADLTLTITRVESP